MMLMSAFDEGVWEATKKYLKAFTENPKAFFSKVHYQSIMIIQPADATEWGDINMCDGCPDITVWNDQLVWSCRMEEQIKWGQNMRLVPKNKE